MIYGTKIHDCSRVKLLKNFATELRRLNFWQIFLFKKAFLTSFIIQSTVLAKQEAFSWCKPINTINDQFDSEFNFFIC